MKNYLFAPFKDHEDKINAFNSMIGGLETMIDEEDTQYHELSGLRIFIGRLESYYDVIISELQAELETANDGINDLNDVLKDMQKESIEQIKENKELKDSIFKADKDYAELKERLKAEIIELEGHVDKYGGIAYDKLKAENEELNHALNEARSGGINQ